MAKFEIVNGQLFVDGQKVIKAWESWNSWYWFAVKKIQTQDSVIDGKVYENDTIYYGLVQGHYEEWGDFSQKELESLKPRIWELRKEDLPYSGKR